jgi:hypothetical protein
MSIAPPARRAVVLGDLLPGALARDIGLVTGGAALASLAFPATWKVVNRSR